MTGRERDILIEELERKLDSFDAAERKDVLATLCEKVRAGEIDLPRAGTGVNLHCHTFFSYNSYGYSPSKFAWLARKAGLVVAGVVDFDVLDALEEFLAASRKLGLKACTGLETRVFVPEFSTRVINSPGEPGISYHMGVGFPTAKLKGRQQKFLLGLRKTAQQRNRELMDRVNKYLRPVELNYERDVLVLTPSGNATERHICLAYARKAKEIFTKENELANFWSEKLGVEINSSELPESRNLLNTIRAKTMKQGGVGYVLPDKGSFPTLADTNQFLLAAGAIPTLTWLDGTSDGEKAIEELLGVAMNTGTAAINVIPDRNYTPGVKSEKLANTYNVIELAEKLNLPVVVGTEMNSPGQKFVDSFDTEELSPLVPIFLKGAHIVYAHSVLQQKCGLGYTSEWAKKNFESVAEKNEFFRKLGSLLQPQQEDNLSDLSEDTTAQQILDKAR
ncbi:MAG: PHP domain-containing protein [Sedimentisphaerales bacterium]|nr:PHP domain-containing protein [Sedimentisphaerales bacterium]